jgi:Protein of Unknown function (DUF2784)
LLYDLAADLVLIAHFVFVLFVVCGAPLTIRWPRLAWLHLPALLWGVLIEFTGMVCPLTPLEIRLRQLGGAAGYEGGFIDHYIGGLLYPAGLTRHTQILLGIAVLVPSVIVYGRWLLRRP